MRIFAQKQKPMQKGKSASPTSPSRVFTGQSREVSSVLHLQRTIGNQAVQRLLQSNTEELQAGSATTVSTRFGHDFSRIPMYSEAPKRFQAKLKVNSPGDQYEREADIVASQVMRMPKSQSQKKHVCGTGYLKCRNERGGREQLQTKLLAHELTHVVQQSQGRASSQGVPVIQRQDKSEKPPAEGSQAPQSTSPTPKPPPPTKHDYVSNKIFGKDFASYKASNTRTGVKFLGVTISGWVHQVLASSLANAELGATEWRGMSTTLKGKYVDGLGSKPESHGLKQIGGGAMRAKPSGHSFGMAIDIEARRQPYIIREAGEAELDKQLKPVYERITQFILDRRSQIVAGPVSGASSDSKKLDVRYDVLLEESKAMQDYFRLMYQLRHLTAYAKKHPRRFQKAFFPGGTGSASISMKLIQDQMKMDYVTLTGRPGPGGLHDCKTNTCRPLAWPTPKKAPGDRPFKYAKGEQNSPLQGFLHMPRDVVQGLVIAGQLRWGGASFGGGDIQHFDLQRQLPKEWSLFPRYRKEYDRLYGSSKKP